MTLLPRGGFTEAMFHSRAGFSLLVFNSAGLSGALLSRKTSFHEPDGKKKKICRYVLADLKKENMSQKSDFLKSHFQEFLYLVIASEASNLFEFSRQKSTLRGCHLLFRYYEIFFRDFKYIFCYF